ncbi:MAG: ParB family chromosome partitioning protein [Psychromonas sp.]|jgi:ParB family chromosome partitioning protein|uniref:ParB/RepB/Spo0J family partition protein n=1 Tax=Psychromonas sp. TaxID=1884585 RepID=UPI0039E6BA14
MLGKKRGLGKGLDSLLSSSSSHRQKQVSNDFNAEKTQQLVEDVGVKGLLRDIDINSLHAGKYQPRREMDSKALDELANSIHAQGIIQPLVIRETGHQKYEIIAGERRWRAAKIAGLANVPCIIKNVEDNAAIAIALIENIQRENLNAMEEAIALKRLLDEFNLTHIEVAKAVGKSRTTISNLLRLNNLNEDVKLLLEHGEIEMGHARALLSLSAEKQLKIANITIDKRLNVRETEKLVKKELTPKLASKSKSIDDQLIAIQGGLSEKLGTSVSLSQSKNGKGKLVISFDANDKLQEILTHFQS